MASAYTDEQIDHYLEHTSLPEKYRRAAKPAKDFALLNALFIHQLAFVPYDNLSLHYSRHHTISLDPQTLYSKIIAPNGRGGYCMENSIFFNHVLRALSFRSYIAGVRVRYRVDGVPRGPYSGWVHIVNIVTLPDGTKYMLDAGFGGDGATKPIPLIHGHITHNIGTQELRLVYDNIPELTDKSQKMWIYQYRNRTDQPWNSFFAFPEVEFLHDDFEVMDWYTSTHPKSFQTYMPLVIKFLLREKSEDPTESEIYGKVMLVYGEVKQNLGGRTTVIKSCKTEEERVDALKEQFGITLTREEVEGIRGMVSELKPVNPFVAST